MAGFNRPMTRRVRVAASNNAYAISRMNCADMYKPIISVSAVGFEILDNNTATMVKWDDIIWYSMYEEYPSFESFITIIPNHYVIINNGKRIQLPIDFTLEGNCVEKYRRKALAKYQGIDDSWTLIQIMRLIIIENAKNIRVNMELWVPWRQHVPFIVVTIIAVVAAIKNLIATSMIAMAFGFIVYYGGKYWEESARKKYISMLANINSGKKNG